ncbi:MAG: hypothetical protein QXM96_01785 [Candidatus Woesearchaeota archaeon]
MIKSKKSQLIIILLVFFLIFLGLILTINFFYKTKNIETNTQSAVSFNEKIEIINDLQKKCIEESTKKAINEKGIYPTKKKELELKEEIEKKIISCFNLKTINTLFEDASFFSPKAFVYINEDTISVNVYPFFNFKDSDGKKYKNEKYTYIFNKINIKKLEKNTDSKLKKDFYLSSTDNNFKLLIEKESKIVDYNENALDHLAVKIKDKNELYKITPTDDYVIGNLVYEVTDSKIIGKGAIVTLNYDFKQVPKAFLESQLSIMTYDKEKGLWRVWPTQVNTKSKTATAIISHFSEVGLTISPINVETPTCEPIKKKVPLFIEHLHIPCKTIETKEYKPEESDFRYVGLYNKKTDNLPPYTEYEDETGWRWKRNNFDEIELQKNLESGEADMPNPKLAGSVYALPNMIKTLQARGGVKNKFDDFDFSENQEWTYTNFNIEDATIYDKNGEIVSKIPSEIKSQLKLNARDDKIFTKDISNEYVASQETGQGRYLITKIDQSGNPCETYDSSGNKKDECNGNGKINYVPLILDDTFSDYYVSLENFNDPFFWEKVFNPETNEYAESDGNIKDWDDDDQESLLDKNCNGHSCLKCNYYDPILSMKVTDFCDTEPYLIQKDSEAKCFEKCKKKAEEIYKKFEAKGFVPWNPSNDGILDFRWVNKKLERTKLTCELDSNYEVYSCDITEKDIATPMFYGYGGTTKVKKNYKEYRLGNEKGYEGAGNNDIPNTVSFELNHVPTCEDNDGTLIIYCSNKDKCNVELNGKKFTCDESICSKTIPKGTLKQGTNTLIGDVLNTITSNDVCASLSVELVIEECTCVQPPPGTPPSETSYCGDNLVSSINEEGQQREEYCDGIETGAYQNGNKIICTQPCRMTGENKCTCCGDGVIQSGENCDNGENNGNPNFKIFGSIDEYCSLNCDKIKIDQKCNDNIVNSEKEYCDGTDMGQTKCKQNTCRSDCTCCGDGVKNADETCDFMDTNAPVGCRDTSFGEDKCTYCGDDIIQKNYENCEPPNTELCNADCKTTPKCQDGFWDPTTEACDDSDPQYIELPKGDCSVNYNEVVLCGSNNVPTCSYCKGCEIKTKEVCCGNNNIESPEKCDPPNTKSCDGSCQTKRSNCDVRCDFTPQSISVEKGKVYSTKMSFTIEGDNCYGGGVKINCVDEKGKNIYFLNRGNPPNNIGTTFLNIEDKAISNIGITCTSTYYISNNYISENLRKTTCNFDLCVKDCSCAENTCKGNVCSDNCGGVCDGTKECCVFQTCSAPDPICGDTQTGTDNCGNPCIKQDPCIDCSCAADTCIGEKCNDGKCDGTKQC